MEKRWGPHHFTWPRFRLVDEAGSDDHTEDSRILVEISPTCYLPNSDTAHIVKFLKFGIPRPQPRTTY